MMNSKSVFLLVLVAMVVGCILPACGDDPDDVDGSTDNEQETDTGGPADTTPLVDPSTLAGRKFILDFSPKYWSKPAVSDVAEALGDATPIFAFEIKSVDVTASTFTALLGTVKNGAQDKCTKTYEMSGTYVSVDPSTGGTTFTMVPMGSTDIETIVEVDVDQKHEKKQADLHNFVIGGQFINQGTGFKYGKLGAELDLRQIYSLFYIFTAESAEDACTKLFDLTAQALCEACSFETTTSLCVTAEASLFKIPTESTGLVLEPVNEFGAGCLDVK